MIAGRNLTTRVLMTTKRRVFLLGFGISTALLAVCAGYGFFSRWRGAILLQFDPAIDHVSLPGPYRYAFVFFELLNVPVAILTPLAVRLAERLGSFSAFQRAVMMLVVALILSALWWWLLGIYGQWFRDRRQRSSTSLTGAGARTRV